MVVLERLAQGESKKSLAREFNGDLKTLRRREKKASLITKEYAACPGRKQVTRTIGKFVWSSSSLLEITEELSQARPYVNWLERKLRT